ncbi:MAG TPA: AAA family ATPase [Leptospiraceae bacterium]|nr:AAA family ATPase [Leptospiraceae bacterium]
MKRSIYLKDVHWEIIKPYMEAAKLLDSPSSINKYSNMQPLPIGIQTFSKIVEGNYLYIDKTRQIHKLIKNTSGKHGNGH